MKSKDLLRKAKKQSLMDDYELKGRYCWEWLSQIDLEIESAVAWSIGLRKEENYYKWKNSSNL